MFQLVANLLFILFIYRSYKLFFSEWCGWQIFIIIWLCGFLLNISLLTTPFWNFICSGNWNILFFASWFIIAFIIINLILFLITLGKLNCDKSEWWWASLYHYYKYYIIFWAQYDLLNKKVHSFDYYSSWYLKQFSPKIFVVLTYILGVITGWYYFIKLNLGFYWSDYFNNYIITMFYSSYYSLAEFIIIIYILSLIAQYFIYLIYYYYICNYINDKYTGQLYIGHFQRSSELRPKYYDFLIYFEYRNNYIEFFRDHFLYELPVNWRSWQLHIIDKYNNIYMFKQWKLIVKCKYLLITWYCRLWPKGRRISEFTTEYNYYILELLDLYGYMQYYKKYFLINKYKSVLRFKCINLDTKITYFKFTIVWAYLICSLYFRNCFLNIGDIYKNLLFQMSLGSFWNFKINKNNLVWLLFIETFISYLTIYNLRAVGLIYCGYKYRLLQLYRYIFYFYYQHKWQILRIKFLMFKNMNQYSALRLKKYKRVKKSYKFSDIT